MTWEQLSQRIQGMTDWQRKTDVSILLMDSDEVCAAVDFVADWEAAGTLQCVDQVEDVLDEYHPFLTVAA